MKGQLSKNSIICSSDMRLMNYPKPQEQKVFIWDKELCNGAEWNDFLKCVEEKSKENAELKQRLADKEKEIESLKDNWNVLCDYLGDCVVKYDEEDVNGIYGEVLDKVNILKRYDYKRYQDKISFAVEQLEKVKEKINDCPITDYDTNKHFVKMYQSDAIRQLDNQIKQLKEMK